MAEFTSPESCRIRSLKNGGGRTPITIPASPFMKKLGCGTGVSVYLMDRVGDKNASPWAIKKLNSKCTGKQAKLYQERLKEEAKVLKGIDHPNIVGFRALATAKDGSKCLAMEFGGERSLYDLIETRQEDGLQAFPAADIEKVALHVARGLQYLHNEKKLLHGDMKSANVVVKGDFDAVKICDVGVSLKLDENMTLSDPDDEYIGTGPWMPKEALEGDVITDKADIFAYGLTLWEMMSLAMPHMGHFENGDEDESMQASFDEDAYLARQGTRPPLDAKALGESYRKMLELFYVCTEEDPKKRPSAAQIVQALEGRTSVACEV
ncbi:lymphokine-activated killer T-cell-originated protein kinase homolog [Corythoichthys intestinalis]|uniref:lymphokine-activated killer T-cell-originated protein kinase homolog n=1 Tax=Corythoichthys intestinalis TaxID=161448 RepID=UPI0025A504F3|nr:lymphokine-activated killer T-cell-originated protein kinase homolog [Corythoichthys intestinalis]XP_061806419.1 lymphokine-activated killer T-cell-originated protein kinase homolog [Nerophis lumbriciformis]